MQKKRQKCEKGRNARSISKMKKRRKMHVQFDNS